MLVLYWHLGFSWPAFALLFLAPDLSMLAYLAGPRAGAVGYNLAHTYALAFALTLVGFAGGVPEVAAGGFIWIAHIGFDRALGYGLKYSTDSTVPISAKSADAEPCTYSFKERHRAHSPHPDRPRADKAGSD